MNLPVVRIKEFHDVYGGLQVGFIDCQYYGRL